MREPRGRADARLLGAKQHPPGKASCHMKKGLDIAFFGSSLVSAYWNGAATYYRGLIRALHERGPSITFYEPDAYSRQQHRDMDDPNWARVVVYPGEGD